MLQNACRVKRQALAAVSVSQTQNRFWTTPASADMMPSAEPEGAQKM